MHIHIERSLNLYRYSQIENAFQCTIFQLFSVFEIEVMISSRSHDIASSKAVTTFSISTTSRTESAQQMNWWNMQANITGDCLAVSSARAPVNDWANRSENKNRSTCDTHSPVEFVCIHWTRGMGIEMEYNLNSPLSVIDFVIKH